MEVLVLWRMGKKYDELRSWRLKELQASCEAEGRATVDVQDPCERGNASWAAFADVETARRCVSRCALVTAAVDVVQSAETLRGTCTSQAWTCSGIQAHACNRKRAESVRSKPAKRWKESEMKLTENTAEMQVDQTNKAAVPCLCTRALACGKGRWNRSRSGQIRGGMGGGARGSQRCNV